MDSLSGKERLPTGVRGGPSLEESPSFLAYPGSPSGGGEVAPGSTGFTKQRGGGRGTSSVWAGVLQHGFSRRKENSGEIPFSNQPQTPECFPHSEAVPNGVAALHHRGIKSGRLGRVIGPVRCISAHTHSQNVEKVPSFCARRQGSAVSGSPFRVGVSPLCFYPNSSGFGSNSTQKGFTPLPLFGRLVTEKCVERASSQADPSSDGFDSRTGISDEPRQIQSDPNSGLYFLGSQLRSSQSFSKAPGRSMGKDCGLGTVSATMPEKPSISLVQSIRPTHVRTGRSSSRQVTSPTVTAPFKQGMEASSHSVRQHCGVRHLPSTVTMVAGERKRNVRDLHQSVLTIDPNVHGRLQYGVGRPCGGDNSVGRLVPSGVITAHQLSGDVGRYTCDKSVPGSPVQQAGVSGHGQLHGSVVHKQTGGYSFPDTVPPGGDTVEFSPSDQVHTSCETHSGKTQCSGRFSISQKSNSERRMESPSRDFQTVGFSLGDSSVRPVCYQAKSQVPPLCLAYAGRKSRRRGRSVLGLGHDGSLCVPSDSISPPSLEQDPTFIGTNSADCPLLAQEGVVPSVVGTVGGQPVAAPVVAEAASATGRGGLAPRSRGLKSSRLATVRESLVQEGFSEGIAKRISEKNRASTNSLYQSRWKAYQNWCSERPVDPFSAPIPVIAEFLLFLFNKGWQLSTIRGYRTAVSETLKFSGRDIGNSKSLSDLLASFQRDRPRATNRMPSWDLALVLRSLTRHPYEPLTKASDKDLSLKTVFLLALATGSRVSELHALDVTTVKFKENFSGMTISPHLRFLGKTQRTDVTQDRLAVISVRALGPSLNVDMTEDRSLCPVRAMRYYLERTTHHRQGQTRLFVSHLAHHKEIGKDSVSVWIRKVIQKAYEHHTEEDKVVLKYKAHDLRALAASWAFHNSVALVDVMNACTWKRHSTFSEFYLRDMASQADDLYQLGPLIVAQHKV
jgi:hypothetical protein